MIQCKQQGDCESAELSTSFCLLLALGPLCFLTCLYIWNMRLTCPGPIAESRLLQLTETGNT